MRGKTKKEAEHLSNVAALGCIVCHNEGHGFSPATIHHVRKHGAKTDHFKSIPLCPPHHLLPYGKDAFHYDSNAWQKRFGTQEELLKQVNEKLQSSESETGADDG